MRLAHRIAEEEMVAHFLQTEIHSARFGEAIWRLLREARLDPRVVEEPDLSSPSENRRRAALLGEWRGYGRNGDVFTDLPDDVRWWRASLSTADLEHVLYLNDAYWTEFSGGSRRVADAARRILSGAVPEAAAGYLALADRLARGARFPEMILLDNPATQERVVLEGHVRVTAHLLHRRLSPTAPAELPILVGCSDRIKK